MHVSKKFLLAAILISICFSSKVFAYTMGSYMDVGGSYSFSSPINPNDKYSRTIDIISGEIGIGYLHPFSQDNNPFFWGIEGSGNVYNVYTQNAFLYGPQISGIIGKQLSEDIAVYGKASIGAYVGNTPKTTVLLPTQLGVGVGYQLSNQLRVTGDVDYGRLNGFVPVTSAMVSLQYSF